MNESRYVDISLVSCSSNDIHRIMLHGDKRFNPSTNKRALTTTFKQIENTQKYDQPLL